MNSLAAPFPSSLIERFSRAITGQRMLLFICLLIFAPNGVRAQEEAKVTERQEARAGASSTGTITGQVVGEDGRPLADAVVYFSRPYARVQGMPQSATTDSEGRFRASGLESGLYIVNALMPGFIAPDFVTDPSEMKFYRIGDNVNLTMVKGGVITGTVRDANGEPVVAISVRASRVRDALGRTTTNRFSGFFPERMTDDRGVYRIYGLPSGTYLISTGGSQRGFGVFNAYEGDAPTFFPSSTRDTAAEVPVRSGEEATNIDIRYRGERGHTVSGTISGVVEANLRVATSIILRPTSSTGFDGISFVAPGMAGFSFNGVSDGEYELLAQRWSGGDDSSASVPRKVTVKGADVTGIELSLSPLASIAGSVQLEAAPKEKCGDGRGGTLEETLINVRRDEKKQPEGFVSLPFFSSSGDIPTEQGEFLIRNLTAGSYRLTTRLPSDNWYVRSIVLPKAAAPQSTAPAKSTQTKSATPAPASSLLALKTGERMTGVIVQIAQDAAGLRGRIAAMAEGAGGASIPPNLKVYLVPVERERAEDVLRYSDASVGSDGTFTLANLAPGRYWLIARVSPENESTERAARSSLFWDAEARARLRREAEAANTTIELQPCQRVNDHVLRYATPK